MIYAQKGSGRRSNLYTDYTFAVKDGDKLVTFTKAYSGLTDKEFAQVDTFCKKKFNGKIRAGKNSKTGTWFLKLLLKALLQATGIKAAWHLRFPRMNRWRKDKKPDEINTIEDLKAMLKMYGK